MHAGDCIRTPLDLTGSRHVIGVAVSVERECEREPEVGNDLEVALHLLEHRVDEDTLACRRVTEEVGVRRGAPARWRGPIKELRKTSELIMAVQRLARRSDVGCDKGGRLRRGGRRRAAEGRAD